MNEISLWKLLVMTTGVDLSTTTPAIAILTVAWSQEKMKQGAQILAQCVSTHNTGVSGHRQISNTKSHSSF